jgi:prevent-host-death family protein
VKPKHTGKRKTVKQSTQLSSPVVSAAYAKLKFADLLKAVERGQTVTIERYNRPVAKLSPVQDELRPDFKFGFLKDVIKIVDPDWEKKLKRTEEEIDEVSKATY